MTPFLQVDHVTIHHGDCLDVLRGMTEASVDAVVTDPPYSLSFMGREWDTHDGEAVDPAFLHWFAGFVDGEGCFHIKRANGTGFSCEFYLQLRADDRPILDRICRTLKLGRVGNQNRSDGGNPMARFVVSNKPECIRLRAIFRAFPLRAKKARDFAEWSQALDAWVEHTLGESWEPMRAAHERLSETRTFDESGVRVDPFQMWCADWGRAALRVLKPGGHLLAFGAPRTYHRLAAGLEDAGFEIRDSLHWIYGTGFPKSLNVSKAMDKARDDDPARRSLGAWLRIQREAAGLKQKDVARHWPSATGGMTGCAANWELGFNCPTWEQWIKLREVLGFGPEMDAEVWRLNGRKGTPGEAWQTAEVVGERTTGIGTGCGPTAIMQDGDRLLRAANSDLAKQWAGWGTALKPGHEPIVMARKPLVGTVAQNVSRFGTGALNIDACRIEGEPRTTHADGNHQTEKHSVYGDRAANTKEGASGRWPANVLLDEGAAAELDAQSGTSKSPDTYQRSTVVENRVFGASNERPVQYGHGDSGGASRFFWCAKPSRAERDIGCEDLPRKTGGEACDREDGSAGMDSPRAGANSGGGRNFHPTVKPVELMRYLVRLITPPGGVVLDPFMGSGTTAFAAHLEFRDFIGIEREEKYIEIAARRAKARAAQGSLDLEATG